MYQSFYKLSGKPFRLSPDPGFFFPSRGHKRALAYLRYGLNQDEGFVVITGAPGTGKTTLAKILLQELGDKNLVVAHLTTTQLEADDMLRMVAASFGLRYESMEKAALLKTLEQFLLARARERKRALLVIDEAQNLPERSLEELRMLSNLQVGDKALVQTFLLGQAQFRQMLDHPDLEQLRQRVIANYHLSPLAPDECQRYIESRMHQVEWNDDPHFAEVAYEMIHEYTEGIPRRINMLCDRILLYACMEELHDITGEVVTLVISELENEVSGKLVSPSEALEDEEDALDIDLMATEARPQEKAQPEAKKEKESSTYAKRVEELSEKIKANTQAEQQDKGKEGKIKEHVAAAEEGDSEVMGNTVTKTKPDASQTENNGPSQTEIDERDLFRVIPGGKTNTSTPAAQPGTYTRPMAPAAQAQPSQEDVVLRRILRLVLAFHRSPSRFPGLDNANQPLPDGTTELLELAVSDDQTLTRVSPAAVMGISPMMLRAAVRFFVRRAFFVLDGDDYRVLGLQPGAPQQLIERHYDLLMRLLRQDKQRGSADSVARIGNAYEALSRLDQAAQAKQTTRHLTVTEESDELDEIEIIEEPSDELTIDFGDVPQQPERRSSASVYGKKPYETFDPDVAISRRRLRFAGQAAVLGFGALVIVLGMYIVQLEPSSVSKPNKKQITITQNFDDEDKTATENKHLPFSFSDGSSTPQSGGDRFDRSPSESNSRSAKSDTTTSSDSDTVALNDIDEPQPSKSSRVSEDDLDFEALTRKSRSAKVRQHDKPRAASASAKTKSVVPAPKVEKPKPSQRSITENKTSVATSHSATDQAASTQNKAAAKAKPATATVVPQSYPGVDIATNDTAASGARTSTVAPTATADTTQAKQVPVASAQNEKRTAPGSTSATGLSVPPAAAVTAPVASGEPAAVASATPAVTDTVKISQDELNGLIHQFEGAYNKGDINRIMSLFAQNARTNSRTSLKGIRADYDDLFKTSSYREIAIKSVFWEFDQQYARGMGDYRARVNPVGGNGSQTFTGKVTIQVRKLGNKLEMTRFYFSNQSVATGASADSAAQSTAISKIEMQNVMTQFIQYYEKGDINGLMAMFAADAQTNDQTTPAGIRKDYQDLFNSTSSRQFSLSKLSWNDQKDGSVSGTGNFEVVVKANGSNTSNTYKGSIKIQAKRAKGKILLTRWLHNVQ